MVSHESLALLTDLYQVTMAQAYFNDHKTERATFSLFIRSYPLIKGFFISAGLHNVLKFRELCTGRAGPRLSLNAGSLSPDFLKFLGEITFHWRRLGAAGRPAVLQGQPILEVTAPIIEAQLVETFIINQNQPTIAHCHQGS